MKTGCVLNLHPQFRYFESTPASFTTLRYSWQRPRLAWKVIGSRPLRTDISHLFTAKIPQSENIQQGFEIAPNPVPTKISEMKAHDLITPYQHSTCSFYLQ